MSYEETINYIHSVQWRGSKPGLSRTRALLAKMGNPENKLKFVHIAGTNGKGSTAACIEAVLRQAGYKTGLYISPYIYRFNERIQICGEPISDEALERVTNKIKPFAEALEDKPTEFEIITAVAMEYFAEQKCDIVVLEVGLGGELDSTNVINTPEVAVITAIGLDHTRELGDTITDIAKAKAGIIKDNGKVVVYGENSEALNVFENTCRNRNAKLIKTDFSLLSGEKFALDCCTFDFKDYKGIRLPLVGTYQPKNASLAITALETLAGNGYKISRDDIISGLGNVSWPGRFEIVSKKPLFVLDGAHNPHGIDATVKSLREHFGDKKIVFLMGVMADKDVLSMVKSVMPIAECFVTVRPNNPRAMDAEKFASVLRDAGGRSIACGSIEQGVETALDFAGKTGIVCAMGSLYFSADVKNAAEKQIKTL